jgi:transcriptional regulator with XRE-family HTH domain
MGKVKSRKRAVQHNGNGATLEVGKGQSRRITNDARALFGKTLNDLMMKQGVSQSDLARHCFGTTEEKGFEVANGRDRISKYLRGKSFPEAATLAKIAEKLECEVADLLPEAVRNALAGEPSQIIQYEMNVRTGRYRVKMNDEFDEAFLQDLTAIVAKFRTRESRKRK